MMVHVHHSADHTRMVTVNDHGVLKSVRYKYVIDDIDEIGYHCGTSVLGAISIFLLIAAKNKMAVVERNTVQSLQMSSIVNNNYAQPAAMPGAYMAQPVQQPMYVAPAADSAPPAYSNTPYK